MKVKICGLSRSADIQAANDMGLDYIGFVFAKSGRQVTETQAKQLKSMLNPNISAVGVFVNAPLETMMNLVESGVIDIIQLHGQEPESTITALKNHLPTTPIIKAISVNTAYDILIWQDSQSDFLLLDNGAGGTGKRFDWNILPQLSALKKPYFIAGGLDTSNVSGLFPIHPYGVDVSGGVETEGLKDPQKMTEFVKIVRSLP